MSKYRNKGLKSARLSGATRIKCIKKKTPSNTDTEKIKNLIKDLEEGNLAPVKNYLKSLLPPPPKEKFNLKELAEKYKEELILKATKAEKAAKILLKLYKIRFEFQHIIYYKSTFYIVDFFIPTERIVIEIDGGYHNDEEQIKKDRARTKQLNKMGLTVLRFTNEEVLEKGIFENELKMKGII